jgi:hypothetical protein
MSSVLNLLFGPLSEYVKTVHTYQPNGVGELSKAHELIKLYVYDNHEDVFMSAPQQARGSKRLISDKFIKAMLACSVKLQTIDKSVTNGSNARNVANRINAILMKNRLDSATSEQSEQSEQVALPSWSVSPLTREEIDGLKKDLGTRLNPDKESIKFIESALYELSDSFPSDNEEAAKNHFTQIVSALIGKTYSLNNQRGSKTDKVLMALKDAPVADRDIFNLFFTVHDTNNEDRVVQLSEIDYRNLNKYRINVKSITSQTGAWINEKIPKSDQYGGKREEEPQRIPVFTFYLPLLGEGDYLDMFKELDYKEQPKYALRLLAAMYYYKPETSPVGEMEVLTISGEAQMKYIACNDTQNNVFRTARSTVNPPELNLTRDYWVKRTDGKYERKQLDGSYKVLTPEECDELRNRNCASSLVSTTHCSDFMKAVTSGDISQLKKYLDSDDFTWEVAEKDLNQMNPNVVLEILKAFGFGPYTNSFGTEKQMCCVDDWLKQPETVKNFGSSRKKVEINGKLRSYLELLVAFVNKNKSILNPHLQRQAVGSVPEEVTKFGVYDGTVPSENTYPKSGCEGPINWSVLRNTTTSFAAPQFGSTATFDPMNPMAYLSNLPGQRLSGLTVFGLGQQGGQRGGALFSQQGGTEVSASSDIKMQLDSVIQMLKQSNKSLSPEDEASLHKKVASFTQLEQELWEQLCKLNRYRECLSMCGDTTPSTVVLRDLDELVQKYKHTGAKYNTNNDCLQNLCYMLTQLLTQNTSNSSVRAITPLP